MLVAEERVWALDRRFEDEGAYKQEFAKRFHAKQGLFIPRDEFLRHIPTRSRVVEAEEIVTDDEPVAVSREPISKEIANPDKFDHRNQMFKCVCGKEVKSKLGFNAHKRKCKEALNSKWET